MLLCLFPMWNRSVLHQFVSPTLGRFSEMPSPILSQKSNGASVCVGGLFHDMEVSWMIGLNLCSSCERSRVQPNRDSVHSEQHWCVLTRSTILADAGHVVVRELFRVDSVMTFFWGGIQPLEENLPDPRGLSCPCCDRSRKRRWQCCNSIYHRSRSHWIKMCWDAQIIYLLGRTVLTANTH
jgi:hypothetical protein